eukprot:CAMPEP_0197537496 /NCGR_PEP_ID=MMETSP1318-20131121/57017_1 /TAXON_ID=552666 /ORGANISM="Partenskyella glossopodia, Strain RCC365" /LENGTH=344 /DNA_ID=CAMNT_0043095673 /DNA_START=87 /DNA_END=1121 /DNA_ORIENTATION=+
MVTTLAGKLPDGMPQPQIDGKASEAIFSWPMGVEVDAANNVYVADTSHGMIRKIHHPEHQVTTLVGTGFGYGEAVDGSLSSALLNNPRHLALDHAHGRLYFTDYSDDKYARLRVITETGQVKTVAGQAGYGYVDGPASLAKFGTPHGLAVDRNGCVFIADAYNHVVRKVTPNLEVTTFAGSGSGGIFDGLALEARFYGPYGVAVDDDGTVYVADTLNNRIRRVSKISKSRFRDIQRQKLLEEKKERQAQEALAELYSQQAKRAGGRRGLEAVEQHRDAGDIEGEIDLGDEAYDDDENVEIVDADDPMQAADAGEELELDDVPIGGAEEEQGKAGVGAEDDQRRK